MGKNIKVIATLYGQHSRYGIIDKKKICCTLVAGMGMGGGFIPMVVKNKKELNI